MAVSIGLILVAMVSVQTGAGVAESMFKTVGAQGAAALRLAFAGLIMLVFWRPWRGGLTWLQARAVLAYGLSLGVMNLLFYLALSRVPLGLAVTLEFSGPLTLAVISSHRRMDLAWVGLAALGIVLLMLLGRQHEAIDPLGAGYAFAAGGCWALYIYFGQKLGGALPSGRATALGMIVAALVVVPFGLIHARGALFTPGLAPVALAVAVLSSVLPYSLEMIAMQRMQARTFGVLMSLEPAVAALSGLAVLGEHLDLRQWAGIGCVMAASFGAAISARGELGGVAPDDPLAL